MNQVTQTVPILRVKSLNKSFPGVKALKNVSFDVMSGEVHALCGENGAGKSTLMRVVAGVETPDQGTMFLNGEQLMDLNEHKAGILGIGMVHQERSLIHSLSIAENVFAARQHVNRYGVIDRKKMEQETTRILRELNLDLDTSQLVSTLSPAQQQMVEIAKALSRQLKVLILDEPTAALTISEAEHLFGVIRHLRGQGVSIIYISHRLAEVFAIADRVTVMKDGEITGVHPIADVTEDELIRLMVGRELIAETDRHRPPTDAPVVLQVESIVSLPWVKKASFMVRRGEIVCIAGLVGAGRTELCETIFGVRELMEGTVKMKGKACRILSPSDAISCGFGMVPEDRKEGGLFLDMSVAANVIASNLHAVSQYGLMSERQAEQLTQHYVEELRIVTPHIHQQVINLSGGNQQKVLLAKWLSRKPTVLIIDEPTKGVDVGARADIYRVLRELAQSGIALVVVSSDLLEVLAISHRIIVMSEGYTVGELDGEEATEMAILKMASPQSKHNPSHPKGGDLK